MSPTRATSAAFEGAYGRPHDGLWTAPGRVNLIGEHTDYNDGFVLPMALPDRVRCAAAARPDGMVRVRSLQMPGETVQIQLAELEPGAVTGWAAYPLGVAWSLGATGHAVNGADLLLDGDVPLGAGLSSSAAVGCAVALALNDLHELGLDRTTLALIAHRAENDFVGAPTGLMDQMVSMHAQAGALLFLDTRTLEISQEPFDLPSAGLVLLVIDTRAPHRLVDSAYAQRRRECSAAARRLGVRTLRELCVDVVDSTDWALMPILLQRRAKHVVTENLRVLETVDHLRRGEVSAIGPVLTASHASLRDDFEVSVEQLDVAADVALAAGAYGARMTGGGFGGCVIALIDARTEPRVSAAVADAFAAHGFEPPRIHTRQASGGAERLN